MIAERANIGFGDYVAGARTTIRFMPVAPKLMPNIIVICQVEWRVAMHPDICGHFAATAILGGIPPRTSERSAGQQIFYFLPAIKRSRNKNHAIVGRIWSFFNQTLLSHNVNISHRCSHRDAGTMRYG